MKAVRALPLDGLSNATWPSKSYDEPTFGPGRLDFVLHAAASLIVDKAFVFESADLSPRWLRHYQLNNGDSRICSDDLPIVVDFVVRDED